MKHRSPDGGSLLPQEHPGIASAIRNLDVDQVILDGEVDWGCRHIEYHVFDILWLNGRDLMPLPFRIVIRQDDPSDIAFHRFEAARARRISYNEHSQLSPGPPMLARSLGTGSEPKV
jgi:hypothetical protein